MKATVPMRADASVAVIGATERGSNPLLAVARLHIDERLRLIAFGTLVAGLVFRTVPLLIDPTGPMRWCDGRAYHDLALSLATGRGLVISDPTVVAICPSGLVSLGPSHHYAPALPMIEALFISIFGNTMIALVLPLVLLSWLAVAAVWFTTRDLFGVDAALLVTAAVSVEWTSVVYGTAWGYSENLVLLAITLTVWAVLRGLKDPRYMALAGLFAGVGYLSKASIGWFFLIAGAGGVLYRVLFRGWRVLLSRWYWLGILVFAIPFAVWSYRNLSLFWDGTLLGLMGAWQTSAVVSDMTANALRNPQLLALGLVGRLPVLAVLFALPFVPLTPAIRAATRHIRDEATFGLWLATGLIFVLGWFFAAVFWVNEQRSLLFADNVRYLMPAIVPLLWLVVRHGQPSTRAWLTTFVIMSAMCFAPPALLLY